MKKTLAIILALVMLLGALTACGTEKDDKKDKDETTVEASKGNAPDKDGEKDTDSSGDNPDSGKPEEPEEEEQYLEGAWLDSDTNTFINFSENGVAAKQGNTHYYMVTNKTGEGYDSYMYREDMTGEHETEIIEISSGYAHYPLPVGRYVYYFGTSMGGNSDHSPWHLYRYDCLTGENKYYQSTDLYSYIVAGVRRKNYVFCDGYLYIAGNYDSVIYKCDLENETAEEFYISDRQIYSIFTDGNKLFYEVGIPEAETICIYSLDFNTKETEMLVDLKTTDRSIYEVVIEGGNAIIYYMDSTVTDGISVPCAYNVATGETTRYFTDAKVEYAGETVEISRIYMLRIGNTVYAELHSADSNDGYIYCCFDGDSAGYVSDIDPNILVYDGKGSMRSELFGLTEIDGYLYYESQEDFHNNVFCMHRITPEGEHQLLEHFG